MMLSKSWITSLFLFLYLQDCSGTDISIVLSNADCSSEHKVPIGGSLLVSASFSSLANNCSLKFRTEDPYSTIVVSSTSEYTSYSYAPEVFVSFFSLRNTLTSLMEKYTFANWSSLSSSLDMQTNSSALVVLIGNARSGDWRLYFKLEPVTGPISDYPFSLAAGVFSLSLGSTVAVALLLTCFWCCCCKKRETAEQASARRRQRMINQLAKEGYSVSRDYGSVGSTQPLIGNVGPVVDIFYQPPVQPAQQPQPAQLPQPQGYQGAYREPPPAYASVETHRVPVHLPSQGRHLVQQAPSVPPPRTVPEGVLIDIGPAAASASVNAPEAPPEEPMHQDLIEFGTPPEQPASPLE